MSYYDYVIVGAGLTGSVIARELAEKYDKKVLIIEKRNHIGGNAYDEYNDANVLIQKYGVHVFHTDNELVFNYLSRFTKWNDYCITCLAHIKNKKTDVPFNFNCIDKFYSKKEGELLKKDLLNEFPNIDRVPVIELINSKHKNIKDYGNFLFENDYRPYTSKQWGRKPEDIDISILNRVKVALSYDNRYFSNKYQCMPKNGFTEMVKNMLNHKNIKIMLNTDINEIAKFEKDVVLINGIDFGKVIYTGALDRLFGYKFGELPYRTLKFRYITFDEDKHLDAPFEVMPMHPKMTRKTEFKSITNQIIKGKTTVVYEYPLEYHKNMMKLDPYYPIISDDNIKMFEKYKDESKAFKNLICCGRLADYKYYDMDNAIARAFEVVELLEGPIRA